MGFFERLEEQAERDREVDEAESESELRLQIEVAASMLQAQDMNRFKAEWGTWLGNLDRAQRETDEATLTPDILATTGDVPKPNAGGLTILAVSNYREFVRKYTKKRLLSISSDPSISTENQRAFWENVQAYVDENLSFIKAEFVLPE